MKVINFSEPLSLAEPPRQLLLRIVSRIHQYFLIFHCTIKVNSMTVSRSLKSFIYFSDFNSVFQFLVVPESPKSGTFTYKSISIGF